MRRIVSNLPRYSANWLRWLVLLGERAPDTEQPLPEPAQQPDTMPEPGHVQPAAYAVSSLFLRRCYGQLTSMPVEDLHLVTGIVVKDVFVLDELVQLRHIRRSLGGVHAGPWQIREGLMLMAGYGLRCGALFHSHPGFGAESTHPSSVDLHNHAAWERAYPVIGGVFGRGGYVRFFSASRPFEVRVHGEKVRRLDDDDLYQLEI